MTDAKKKKSAETNLGDLLYLLKAIQQTDGTIYWSSLEAEQAKIKKADQLIAALEALTTTDQSLFTKVTKELGTLKEKDARSLINLLMNLSKRAKDDSTHFVSEELAQKAARINELIGPAIKTVELTYPGLASWINLVWKPSEDSKSESAQMTKTKSRQ